ncbi:MAG: CoA transferase, partial [Alphaproteobacteria bacterium]
LAQAMGRPELAEDRRYATHSARGARQKELDESIAAWTSTIDGAALADLLDKQGVPNGHIYRAPEMLKDPHFAAREAIVRVAHRSFGRLAMQNVVPRLSETPGKVVSAGPELAEHNDEVYRGLLGLNEATIEKLRAERVI